MTTKPVQLPERLLESLAACAKREGTDVETLAARWLSDREEDEMRRRLLEAANASNAGYDKLIIIEKTCAVTAFDLKVQVTGDGRERGLWFRLNDESPQRERTHQQAFEAHLKLREKFWSEKASDSRFNGGLLDEAGLLEWPAVKAVHAAIGKALRSHK